MRRIPRPPSIGTLPRSQRFGLRRFAKAVVLPVLTILALCTKANAGAIYLSDTSNVPLNPRFGVLNTSDNAFAVESTSQPYYFGLAYDGTGTLYAIDNSFHLDVVNPATGAAVTTIGAGPYFGTLSSPVSGGTLYEVSTAGSLYTIDPTTGDPTLIGSLGISLAPDYATAFGPDGNLYLEEVTSFDVPVGTSELYEINTGTGHATDVGTIGDRITTLLTVDNTLAGFTGTSANISEFCTGCPEELVGINTTTGAVTGTLATLPQPYSGGSQVQAAVEAFGPAAAPEPNTLIAMLAGIALMAAARRAGNRRRPF